MEEIKDVLSKIFLFKGIDLDEIDTKFNIADSILITNYLQGDLILSSDNPTDSLGILQSGKGRITSYTAEHETVIKYVLPGDVFGAATLFSDITHSTKVYAASDAKVIFIHKNTIYKLIENSSIVALNYINFLSDKISFLNRKVAAFTAGSAEIKLAMYLYGNIDDKCSVAPKTSMSALSDQLGIGRASLYRAIDSLSDAGIITYNGKRFDILDCNALIKLVK